MRLRTLLSVALTMFALPALAAELPAAPMPREARPVKVYPLKNASARLVAEQLQSFWNSRYPCECLQQNEFRVAFDVANNIVFVQGSPGDLKDVEDLIAIMDEKVAARRTPHVYRLRNAAAADAAQAIATYLKANRLEAAVIADPVSNSVLVAANAELQNRIIAMLDGVDKAPAQVVVTAMVMEVPRGFTADVGLADGKSRESAWVLSEREMRMFMGLIRAAKGRDEIDILSRPMLQLADNQTGCVQVGQDLEIVRVLGVQQAGATTVERKSHKVPLGINLQVRPRVAPDGKSLQLRARAEVTTVSAGTVQAPVTVDVPGLPFPLTQFVDIPAFSTQVAETAAGLRFGEALVLETSSLPARGSFLARVRHRCCASPRTTLVLIMPHLVAPEVVRPAGGVVK